MPKIGDIIAALMELPVQGGRIETVVGNKIKPVFRCCVSGTETGVQKLPVPQASCVPKQAFVGDDIDVQFTAYSPMYLAGGAMMNGWVFWGDGNSTVVPPNAHGNITDTVSHSYAAAGRYEVQAQVLDIDGYYGKEIFEAHIIPVDYAHGLILLAATDDGVYKSTDGGQNWTRTLNQTYVMDLKIDPFTISSRVKRVFAVSYDGGIYVSYNSGTSWARYANITGGIGFTFFPTRQNAFAYLYAVDANTYRVRYTLDNGINWTSYTFAGNDADEARIKNVLKTSSSIAVSSHSRYIYAYTETAVNAFIKRIDTLVPAAAANIFNDTRGNGHCIKCAPRSLVYIGTSSVGTYDIVVSDDFGDTWTTLDEMGYTNFDIRDIVVSANNPKHIALLMDTPGSCVSIISYDGGGSWMAGNVGGDTPLCGASLRTDPEFFIIGTDNGVYEAPGSGFELHDVSGGGFAEVVNAIGVIE